MVRCEILQHYQLACIYTHVCTHSLDRSNLFYSTRGLKKNQKFRKKPYLMWPQCCIVPCTHILNYPHTGLISDKTRQDTHTRHTRPIVCIVHEFNITIWALFSFVSLTSRQAARIRRLQTAHAASKRGSLWVSCGQLDQFVRLLHECMTLARQLRSL